MSKIEWTHRPGTKSEVWNPTTGCDKVSAGCRNCYAEVMHKRLRGMGQKKYKYPFLGHLALHADELLKPLSWRKPRTVFVNSMSDLFHKDVPFDFIDKVFAVMVGTPQHTYQILTKRADRLQRYFSEGKDAMIQRWADAALELGISPDQDDPDQGYCAIFTLCDQEWPRKNIWIGVSAENQETFDERYYHLSKIPAHVRFISYEPALGPLKLPETPAFQWLIAGGESGLKARPAHIYWFRSVRDQCKSAGVKFFLKQWGTWVPAGGRHRSGEDGKFAILYDTGNFVKTNTYPRQMMQFGGIVMSNVGKSKSGHVLDGVEHLEFPE
jgi:protein gp37